MAGGKQKQKKNQKKKKAVAVEAAVAQTATPSIPAPMPHSTINYDRFDHIDVDSEDESPPKDSKGHGRNSPVRCSNPHCEYCTAGGGESSEEGTWSRPCSDEEDDIEYTHDDRTGEYFKEKHVKPPAAAPAAMAKKDKPLARGFFGAAPGKPKAANAAPAERPGRTEAIKEGSASSAVVGRKTRGMEGQEKDMAAFKDDPPRLVEALTARAGMLLSKEFDIDCIPSTDQMRAHFRANPQGAWESIREVTEENSRQKQAKQASGQARDSGAKLKWPKTLEDAEKIAAYASEKLGYPVSARLGPFFPTGPHPSDGKEGMRNGIRNDPAEAQDARATTPAGTKPGDGKAGKKAGKAAKASAQQAGGAGPSLPARAAKGGGAGSRASGAGGEPLRALHLIPTANESGSKENSGKGSTFVFHSKAAPQTTTPRSQEEDSDGPPPLTSASSDSERGADSESDDASDGPPSLTDSSGSDSGGEGRERSPAPAIAAGDGGGSSSPLDKLMPALGLREADGEYLVMMALLTSEARREAERLNRELAQSEIIEAAQAGVSMLSSQERGELLNTEQAYVKLYKIVGDQLGLKLNPQHGSEQRRECLETYIAHGPHAATAFLASGTIDQCEKAAASTRANPSEQAKRNLEPLDKGLVPYLMNCILTDIAEQVKVQGRKLPSDKIRKALKDVMVELSLEEKARHPMSGEALADTYRKIGKRLGLKLTAPTSSSHPLIVMQQAHLAGPRYLKSFKEALDSILQSEFSDAPEDSSASAVMRNCSESAARQALADQLRSEGPQKPGAKQAPTAGAARQAPEAEAAGAAASRPHTITPELMKFVDDAMGGAPGSNTEEYELALAHMASQDFKEKNDKYEAEAKAEARAEMHGTPSSKDAPKAAPPKSAAAKAATSRSAGKAPAARKAKAAVAEPTSAATRAGAGGGPAGTARAAEMDGWKGLTPHEEPVVRFAQSVSHGAMNAEMAELLRDTPRYMGANLRPAESGSMAGGAAANGNSRAKLAAAAVKAIDARQSAAKAAKPSAVDRASLAYSDEDSDGTSSPGELTAELHAQKLLEEERARKEAAAAKEAAKKKKKERQKQKKQKKKKVREIQLAQSDSDADSEQDAAESSSAAQEAAVSSARSEGAQQAVSNAGSSAQTSAATAPAAPARSPPPAARIAPPAERAASPAAAAQPAATPQKVEPIAAQRASTTAAAASPQPLPQGQAQRGRPAVVEEVDSDGSSEDTEEDVAPQSEAHTGNPFELLESLARAQAAGNVPPPQRLVSPTRTPSPGAARPRPSPVPTVPALTAQGPMPNTRRPGYVDAHLVPAADKLWRDLEEALTRNDAHSLRTAFEAGSNWIVRFGSTAKFALFNAEVREKVKQAQLRLRTPQPPARPAPSRPAPTAAAAPMRLTRPVPAQQYQPVLPQPFQPGMHAQQAQAAQFPRGARPRPASNQPGMYIPQMFAAAQLTPGTPAAAHLDSFGGVPMRTGAPRPFVPQPPRGPPPPRPAPPPPRPVAGPAPPRAPVSQPLPPSMLLPTSFETAAASGSSGQDDAELAHECVVCMDWPIEVVLIPCGHADMCNKCANEIFSRKPPECPTCRMRIESVIPIPT